MQRRFTHNSCHSAVPLNIEFLCLSDSRLVPTCALLKCRERQEGRLGGFHANEKLQGEPAETSIQ